MSESLDLASKSMVDVKQESPMKQFYCDKTIFVTGGTGFLGILLIEKLLRCKAKTIYVLVRPKKNKSPAERIQETFAGEIFTKLEQLDPDYMTKIKLIEGDTFKADLGISEDDRMAIIANVEIVIHAAADIRFDKPLQQVCLTNVRGTKFITLLAEQMKNLIVFAYLSTSFSQFYRDRLEEKFYPPACDPDEMIRIAEHFEKHQTDELDVLTHKFIRPWENTYVFSKSLSEEVVRRVAHKFPTIVVRPSLVISTYEDPLPGWVNNIIGLNGLCLGIGLGFIKVALGNKHSKSVEVVCADFVTNGTLAAMWNKVNATNGNVPNGGAKNRDKFDLSNAIVHMTSQDHVTCGQFQEKMMHWYGQYPAAQSLSAPSITFTTGLTFFLLTIMCHVIPAIVLDAFFRVTKNKMRLLPLYRKFQDFSIITAFYSNRKWHFENKNLKRIIETTGSDTLTKAANVELGKSSTGKPLENFDGTAVEIKLYLAYSCFFHPKVPLNENSYYRNYFWKKKIVPGFTYIIHTLVALLIFGTTSIESVSMSEDDQRYFPCDIFKFKTLEHTLAYHLGLRKYLAKEPLDADQINVAKRRYMILRIISYLTTILYYSILGGLLYMFLHVTGVEYYIKLICTKRSLLPIFS